MRTSRNENRLSKPIPVASHQGHARGAEAGTADARLTTDAGAEPTHSTNNRTVSYAHLTLPTILRV